MIVQDVIDRVKQIIGVGDLATQLEYLSDAQEVLSKKGTWDPSLVYLDIPTVSGNLVFLPDFVEDVLKCNINRQPSFARGRLFEFKQNTDGSVIGDELDYSWADRGEQPIQIVPTTPFQLKATAAGAIRAYGIDVSGNTIFSNGEEGYDVTTAFAGPTFAQITGIKKSTSAVYVSLVVNDATNTVIGTYEPREYTPLFRVIKVSKNASAVRLLVRRRSYYLTSLHDWIPLNSRLAITYMVKSIFLGRRNGSDPNEVAFYDNQAFKYLQEEQDQRNAHSKLADEGEIQTARNQSYETSDCVIVGDIYDQACEIFGNIGRNKIFDRITDSISLGANETNWDALTAWMDISIAGTCPSTPLGGYEFTLPTWVQDVLKVNIGGLPSTGQDRWFEFHRNGPGEFGQRFWNYTWADRGDYPTVKDVAAPARFAVVSDTNLDNGAHVYISGFLGNDRVYDPVTGSPFLTMVATFGSVAPDVNMPKMDRVDRVWKEKTIGYIRVVCWEDQIDPNSVWAKIKGTQDAAPKLISQFRPEETEVRYRRIKVPMISYWIRALVRKKTYCVTSLNDVIPLYDKNALVALMKAKKALDSGKLTDYDAYRAAAITMLEKEESSRNGVAQMQIEVDMTTAPGGQMLLR